jgi:hypothetical protein
MAKNGKNFSAISSYTDGFQFAKKMTIYELDKKDQKM